MKTEHPVLLYDGICNLCNSWVKFVLKHDKKKRFLFASLQSDAAEKVLLQYEYKNMQLDSVVLIANGRLYDKSAAVFQILKILGSPWSWLRIFSILPKGLNDYIYDQVAKNRYRWFGKRDSCLLMIPEYKNRFI